MEYFTPPTSPHLNDSLFVSYGFYTGTSTAFQRQQAYRIAQSLLEQEIGTFISPRTITGSYPFVSPNSIVENPVGMINSINSVVLYEAWENGIDRLISGTYRILNPEFGLFMVDASLGDVSTCIGCSSSHPRGVYKAEISITAGYQTGIMINNPNIELALCMVTDIVLPQMFDQGLGFEYWGFDQTVQVGRTIKTLNTRYLYNTAFGVSSKAQFIRTLIQSYKINSGVGKLGR